MARTIVREVERIPVRSEDGAYETTVVVRQEFFDAEAFGPPRELVPGIKDAKTVEGFACNYEDDNTFEVVNDPFHPDMIVHRVIPGGSPKSPDLWD